LGPTLAIGKQFFDKQLRTNFSSSYNTSYTNGEQQNSVFNFRLGGNYVWLEQHNFSLNLLTLLRNASQDTNTDFTATFGYSYSFNGLNLKLKRKQRIPGENEAKKPKNHISFRYKNVTYSGTPTQINEQLTNVFQSSEFQDIPSDKKKELYQLLDLVKQQKNKNQYKESALVFLEELYSFENFKAIYDEALYKAITRIKGDMRYIDFKLEKSFVKTKVKLDDQQKESPANTQEIDKLEIELNDRQKKLVGHRWMQKNFRKFKSIEVVKNPEGFLKDFKEKMTSKTYQLYDSEKDIDKIELYLESQIIDFYYKESLGRVDPDTFELRYIIKN